MSARHSFSHKPPQSFAIGSQVRIGFLEPMTVLELIETPRDGRPNFYVLRGARGFFYAFQPHAGGILRFNSQGEARHAFI